MSEKNRLQEFCQKHKINFPIYQSWSIGQPHQLQWYAKAVINIQNDTYEYSSIEPSRTKVAAECDVAAGLLRIIPYDTMESNESYTNLLNDISILHNNQTNVLTSQTNMIINRDDVYDINTKNIFLLDLENKPFFKKKYDVNNIYIGFMNSLHHSLNKYVDWMLCDGDDLSNYLNKSNKLLYIIDGGTRDLADHYMTMYLYPLCNHIKTMKIKCRIHIVSGDHAGWCTRHCLEKILIWQNILDVEIINTTNI